MDTQFRRSSAVIVCSVLAACSPGTRDDQIAREDSALVAPASTSFQSADSAGILFEIGRTELAREGYDSATVAYMKTRPDQFFYNSNHDFYAYNGYHFRELLRRFPESELADDAAYALTHLKSEGNECEGWVPCYIQTQWDPIGEFVRAYPASPLADSALTRGLELFGRLLDPKVYNNPYEYEAKEMNQLLLAFDSVTDVLSPPLRARADSAVRTWRRSVSTR